jgi:hypothetical protein
MSAGGFAVSASKLVGRKEELDLLRRRWERARNGAGQLALVVGEPGIGKSRLVEEFRLRLGETQHTWSEFSSSQRRRWTTLTSRLRPSSPSPKTTSTDFVSLVTTPDARSREMLTEARQS